jgi:predicted RND superfamily exporter protein
MPITFGIGVDYAVNVHQRRDQSPDVFAALRDTAGPILLCSLTTIIGYAVLVIADNQAMRTFGLTAVLGEVACLAAALLALPAVMSSGLISKALKSKW